MDDSQIFIDPQAWTEYTFKLNPYRYQTGNAGAFFSFIPGLTTDVLQQMITDCLLLKIISLGKTYSPNDILGYLGKEFGLIQFETESENDFRNRILTKWDYVRTYGQSDKMLSMINSSLIGSYVSNIIYNLDGTDQPIPPYKTGLAIPPYPPSTENNTQFNVVLYVNNSLGSGIYSDLLSDHQISLVREIIRLTKPVNWACREIIIIYNPNSVKHYDGNTYWDDSISTWDDPSNGFLLERHNYYIA